MKPKTYRYKGESKTLGEWAKQLGIPYNNLFMRLKQGWDFARAVEEPIRPRGTKGKKKGKGRRKRGTEEGGEDAAPKTRKKGRRGRPRKGAATDATPPTDATRAAVPPLEGEAKPEGEQSEAKKGPSVPNKPRVMTKDFLRGMAEGIWLTISSVAMMMAEGGAEAAGKNLQRVEEMFKGGFAEKFASAVTGKGK